MKKSNEIVKVRASSVIKLKCLDGGIIDLNMKAGNDLISGINDALSFAGYKGKVVLVEHDK